jgi:hypothetical protein
MKKNTLLLVGIGAAALFFLMRRGGAQGRRRGLLDVQSPEIISQEEFEMPTIEENQRPSIVDTVQNIAQRGGEIFQNVREGIQQRRANDMIYMPGTAIPTGLTRQQLAKMQRQKRQQAAKKTRQQARATRQAARTTRKTQRQAARTTRRTQRRARRQKVGEIGVLF